MIQVCPSLDRNALAYSTTSISAVLINSLFRFYYVTLFIDHYQISESWFHIAQVFYMIWNAVNDPLFAYWQDNSSIKAFRSRRHAIMYGAPLFVLSFLVPWFPWKNYEPGEWLIGVHLTVSLCLWDALFTFVILSHCALYAEISTRHEDRLRLTRYATVASMIGSTSVLFCEFFSDNMKNFHAFQCWCVFAAALSWAGMYYTGKNVRTQVQLQTQTPDPDIKSATKKASSDYTLSQFKEIVLGRNFLIFILTNFVHIFHSEYGVNFLSIFVTQLIPESDFPTYLRKLMFGSTFILPRILVLLISALVSRFGYYRVLIWSFYFKMASGFLMFVAGSSHTLFLVFFLLLDRSLASAIFAFFNLCLSDIIDEDQKRYSRNYPLSSSVFGYNALFTKPAVSVAPMVVVAILNRFGYKELQEETLSPDDTHLLHSAMFVFACCVPLLTGVVQFLIWRNYTIRDSHIVVTKHVETT